MNKTETHSPIFLLIVLMPILGFYVGTMIEMSQDDAGYGQQQYKPWEQIEGPYRFTEIVDATSDTVWARTAEGQLYSWDFTCAQDHHCLTWIETYEVPVDIRTEQNEQLPFEKGRACPLSHRAFSKEPPPTFVECALGSYMTFVWVARYYALLDDGTLWYWRYPVGNDVVGPAGLPAGTGLIAGVLAGLMAFSYLSTAGKKHARLVGLFAVFSTGGVVLAMVFGIIAAQPRIAGFLTTWKPVASPYKFSEITNANTERIWAKSTDGQLYLRDCEYQEDCTWLEINYEPDYLAINNLNDELALHKDNGCPANENFVLSKEPVQKVRDCTFVWKKAYMGTGGHGGYYAVLDDGTISFLGFSNEAADASRLFSPYVPYGLAAGILLFICFSIMQKRKD